MPWEAPCFPPPGGWHCFCALFLSSTSWTALTPSHLPHPANPKVPPTEQAQLLLGKVQFGSILLSLPLVPPHHLKYFPLCHTATGLFNIKHTVYGTIYCKQTQTRHHTGQKMGQGNLIHCCEQPSILLYGKRIEVVKMNQHLKEKRLFSACRVRHCPATILSWMHNLF